MSPDAHTVRSGPLRRSDCSPEVHGCHSRMSWHTGGVGSKPWLAHGAPGRTRRWPRKLQQRRGCGGIQRAALTLLVISGAINTMDRAALAIANPLVRHDFGLSIAQMGALLSAFLWAYAFSNCRSGR